MLYCSSGGSHLDCLQLYWHSSNGGEADSERGGDGHLPCISNLQQLQGTVKAAEAVLKWLLFCQDLSERLHY